MLLVAITNLILLLNYIFIRETCYLLPFVVLNYIFTDTPTNMDDIDLKFDEIELVAAAAGYSTVIALYKLTLVSRANCPNDL